MLARKGLLLIFCILRVARLLDFEEIKKIALLCWRLNKMDV